MTGGLQKFGRVLTKIEKTETYLNFDLPDECEASRCMHTHQKNLSHPVILLSFISRSALIRYQIDSNMIGSLKKIRRVVAVEKERKDNPDNTAT